MNIKTIFSRLTPVFLLAFLFALPALSTPVRAYDDLTASDLAIDFIRRYEGFRPEMYYQDGHWYVGYGTQVKEGAYPGGVTEAEAEALVREELRSVESVLNAFFARNHLSPTQAQFDALVDFTYNFGSSWLSGSSDLVKIVRGEKDAGRLETAHAFGEWCHAGGVALPGLANRRLEEAALYLDGSADAAASLAYLIVPRESGVDQPTDFAVYERGGVYDAFPAMLRLGYTFRELRTADGRAIRLGDPVEGNRSATAVWEKNVYTERFSDVSEEVWFYDYVMELCEGGVIDGRGDGTYDPDAPITVGEALKLVILAAGQDEQGAEDGAHWASGYATLARENSYLPDALLYDLDQPILRVDVAQLAAKAIGFGQSFSDSPFADVDDGYVTALAEVDVFTGSTAHGESVFYPNEPLKRAEVAAIIWRLRRTVVFGTEQRIRYSSSRTLDVIPGVPFSSYQRSGFSGSGKEMSYTENGVTALRGIDVSNYQGAIDWNAVKAQGIDFAILRLGYRGYGPEGNMRDDARFEENYALARAAGVSLGVYFFSQATSIEEALEEADYVLARIADKHIDGPVVFDWETIGGAEARTDNVPNSLVTDCAIAYCDYFRARGYQPMVYMNRYDAYIRYDLDRLLGYDWWYAGEYNGDYPKFFYNFQMWQYTSSGRLDGIGGDVDMDLWLFR